MNTESTEQQSRLIVITGPTCGGKTTLKRALIKGREASLTAVITTTTREPRAGEVDGTDYRFVQTSEFKRLIATKALLEWVCVDGYFYGVEQESVSKACAAGKHGVIVVNPAGMEALEAWSVKQGVRLVRIFASAPIDVLRTRLAKRRAIASDEEVMLREQRLAAEADAWATTMAYDLYAGENHSEAVEQALRQIA